MKKSCALSFILCGATPSITLLGMQPNMFETIGQLIRITEIQLKYKHIMTMGGKLDDIREMYKKMCGIDAPSSPRTDMEFASEFVSKVKNLEKHLDKQWIDTHYKFFEIGLEKCTSKTDEFKIHQLILKARLQLHNKQKHQRKYSVG